MSRITAWVLAQHMTDEPVLVAEYLTAGGGTVTIHSEIDGNRTRFRVVCRGCGDFETVETPRIPAPPTAVAWAAGDVETGGRDYGTDHARRDARRTANTHAAMCRCIPQPTNENGAAR